MSTNEIFNQMLSAYDLMTERKKRNATFEVNQQIILAGLYNGDSLTRQPFMAAPESRGQIPLVSMYPSPS